MARTGTTPDGQHWVKNETTGDWEPVDFATYERARLQPSPVPSSDVEDVSMRRVRAARMASEEYNLPEALGLMVGKGASDIWEGGKHLYHKYLGDEEKAEAIEREMQLNRAADRALMERAPFLMGVAKGVPNIVGGGVVGVGKSLASAFLRQAAMGGALGGMQYAPTLGKRAEQAGSEATMAVLGEGVGRGIGKFFTPGLTPVDAGTKRVLREAEQQVGMETTPATYSEAPLLRDIIEGGMESIPTSSHFFDAIRSRNQGRLNKAAAEAIGEPQETAITDVVLSRAQNRIGKVFDDVVGQKSSYNLMGAPKAKIERIYDDRILPVVGPKDPVGDLTNRLKETMKDPKRRGILSGTHLYSLVKSIRNRANSVIHKDNELGKAYYDVHNILMEAIQKQLPEKEFERLTTARRQYRDFLDIKYAANPVSGDVAPHKLATRLGREREAGYTLGQERGPFYTSTRFLDVVQPALRSSKTPERQWLSENIRTAQGLLAGGGGVGGFMSGDPVIGLGALALPYALPYLGARAYLSAPAKNWFIRQPLQSPQMPIPKIQKGRGLFFAPSAGTPIPGTPEFRLTQQGLLGMTGLGTMHGLSGSYEY